MFIFMPQTLHLPHTHCFSGILALSNTSFSLFSSLSGHRFSSFSFLIPAYLSGIVPNGSATETWYNGEALRLDVFQEQPVVGLSTQEPPGSPDAVIMSSWKPKSAKGMLPHILGLSLPITLGI